MYRNIVPSVLRAYSVDSYSVGDAQKGYRNESYPIAISVKTTFNLIFFKREPGIIKRVRRADYVSGIAAAEGLPVRVRYDKRLIRVANDLYAGLYTYLNGNTVAWEAMTMKHIKLVGAAMGDLHTVLRSATPIDGHSIGDDLLPQIERMKNYFSNPDVQQAMSTKLTVVFDVKKIAVLERVIRHISALPGQQLIHMDMVRGNILFDKAVAADRWQMDDLALTGIIDFEKATVGHPLFDQARTLAFLIVDCPKPPAKIYKYFLDSGYHKRSCQPLPDLKLLTVLIEFFLVHDFYKFLRHTPYESLRDNYHYNRTSNVLQQYGMISSKH